MRVRDVMTTKPQVTTPSTTLGDAAEQMAEGGFRHLPVVEGGALVGMVSERDLRSLILPRLIDRQALEEIRARYDAPVSELMVPDVETVDPETSIRESAARLLEAKVGALPVVDPSTGQLEGIVSYVDLLRALSR
ncbi:MAG: CBS domain-containing protein [Myxococcota bacterium]